MPRPRRPGVPVVGTLVTLGVWGIVAHDSGVGWVQALGALVAGFLAVGLVAPAVAVLRARCSVVACPPDAVAGHPVRIDVAVSAPLELRPVDPPGPAVLSRGGPTCELEVRPPGRGVVDRCTVVMASAAPFGLLWWTREVALSLPRPLVVAPRTGAPDRTMCAATAGADTSPAAAPGHGDEVRGVRPYELGDRRHLVHWPATAHTGGLMVRETERAGSRLVTVRAVLPDDAALAEEAAERGMGTVAELLAAGERVLLVTIEPGGPVTAPVASGVDAGRRLARALPRPGAAGALGGMGRRRGAARRGAGA